MLGIGSPLGPKDCRPSIGDEPGRAEVIFVKLVNPGRVDFGHGFPAQVDDLTPEACWGQFPEQQTAAGVGICPGLARGQIVLEEQPGTARCIGIAVIHRRNGSRHRGGRRRQTPKTIPDQRKGGDIAKSPSNRGGFTVGVNGPTRGDPGAGRGWEFVGG